MNAETASTNAPTNPAPVELTISPEDIHPPLRDYWIERYYRTHSSYPSPGGVPAKMWLELPGVSLGDVFELLDYAQPRAAVHDAAVAIALAMVAKCQHLIPTDAGRTAVEVAARWNQDRSQENLTLVLESIPAAMPYRHWLSIDTAHNRAAHAALNVVYIVKAIIDNDRICRPAQRAFGVADLTVVSLVKEAHPFGELTSEIAKKTNAVRLEVWQTANAMLIDRIADVPKLPIELTFIA